MMICRPGRLEAIQKYRRPDRDSGGRPEKIKMKLKTIIAAGLILAVQLGITAARAQTSEVDVNALLQRIQELEQKVKAIELEKKTATSEPTPNTTASVPSADTNSIRELDQKIRVLERNQELATEAAEARAKETPRLSVGNGGFALSSADTNFVLKLRGLVQIDTRTFLDDNSASVGNDGFVVRRARPILEGTVYRDFDFQLTPDFAGSSATLVDAWVNYRYRPELQFRIGKMKGPVGLENLQADTVGSFNERSMVSALVPVRNIGFQLGGDLGGGIASYALGIYNGAGDGRNPANNDFNDAKEYAGRLFLQPFKKSSLAGLQGLGFGVGGSYADVTANVNGLPNTTGGTLPGYTTSGLQQFFAYNPAAGAVMADGVHWRLSPQGYYYYGSFGLLGEYVVSDQGVLNTTSLARANLAQTAWQVSAQWVLTGEAASFTGITPQRAFDPRNGNWGAWQLVARYAQLDIDSDTFGSFANPVTSANSAQGWSVGLNWWLNRNLRVLTSYSRTSFDGGGGPGLTAPAAVTQQPEQVFLTRVQLSF